MQSQLQCLLLSSVPKKPPLSLWSSTTTSSCIVYAVNKDSSSSSSSSSSSQSPQEGYDFNFDKDKARQALKDLDQQLDTLYEKQASSPKLRVVEDDLSGMEEMAEREMPDFSGAFLPYFSLFLIAFTIFYNVLFYTVIKPAVDGSSEPLLASASAPAEISAQTLDEPVLQNPLPEEAT